MTQQQQWKGAVFFDADGTLVDGREGIVIPTAKTLEAIDALKARGYLVALATGRSRGYVPQGRAVFDGYITSNGAYAEMDAAVVHDEVFPEASLRALIRFFDRHGFNYVLEGQWACFCKDLNEPSYRMMMANYRLPDEQFFPLEQLDGLRVNKMIATFSNPEMYHLLQREMGARFRISGQPGNLACDIGMAHISKGVGVRKVLQAAGLDGSDNTYAFGDADNDIEMFQAVRTGVAMGLHTPRLREAAAFVTKTVREEGIYYAVKTLGLF